MGYIKRIIVVKYLKQIHYAICEVIDHYKVTGKTDCKALHKLLTDIENMIK